MIVAMILIGYFSLVGIVVTGLAIYGVRKSRPVLYRLLTPFVAVAWIADVLLNQILHLLLWDFVAVTTVTKRLKIYIRERQGWRKELALYLRTPINALDKDHL